MRCGQTPNGAAGVRTQIENNVFEFERHGATRRGAALRIRCASPLRVLSHLPHLVQLNRTRVFLSRLGRWECSNHTRVRTKSGPNKRTSLRRWSQYAFKRTLEWFVCGENAIRPQTDPTAKRTAHFCTKPAAVVSCAVHYGMRKCLLTVCSLARQVVNKLGVVRRCGASYKFGDLWCAFAVCSALIHYFPAASALHSQKWYIQTM